MRRFLHNSGCDIHITNAFGCNAVLWSAQGDGSSKSLAWLLECGADFSLVNSNGHSALHKAAQRGSSQSVKWLVHTFLLKGYMMGDQSSFIAPDADGNCPSDLCGMEGHELLARWLSGQECDYMASQLAASNGLDFQHIPPWLRKELHGVQALARAGVHDSNADEWGAGYGLRRMALHLLRCITTSSSAEEVVADRVTHDFNDVD